MTVGIAVVGAGLIGRRHSEAVSAGKGLKTQRVIEAVETSAETGARVTL